MQRSVIAINGSNLSAEQLLQLISALKSGQSTKPPENTAKTVLNSLPKDKKAQVTDILKDKQKLEELLKSEQAQELWKKFSR